MPEIRAEIEQLQSVFTECEDLEREDNFPSLKRQLAFFMKMLQKQTAFFKKKIGGVSADNEDYDAFMKELQEVSASCSKWLFQKKAEMKPLQAIFKSLESKGTPLVSSEDLDSLLIINRETKHLVCLAFTLSSEGDAQFSNMQAFLKKCVGTASRLDVPLFRGTLQRFTNLQDGNQRNKDVKFVATEEPLRSLGCSEKPGVCIRYYCEGEHKSLNLRDVDVSSDSVVLAWDCSLAQLSGKEDQVQYKTDGDDWQTSSAECKGRKATIQGLQPATEYTFRVHAPDQIFLEEIVKVNTEPLQDTELLQDTEPLQDTELPQDTEPSSLTFYAVLAGIVGVVGIVLVKYL